MKRVATVGVSPRRDYLRNFSTNRVSQFVLGGVFVFAVLHGGLWLVVSEFADVPDVPDTLQYDELARNLITGKGYVLSQGEGYEPTLLREPGYPAFLALVYGITGYHRTAAKLIQILLFGVISLLAYVLALELLASRQAALAVGGLTAGSFSLASYSTLLLSENLITLILLTAVITATRALRGDRFRFLLITGGLLGFAVLIKAILLPLVFFVALIVFLNRGRTKSAYLGVSLLILSFSLVVGPWSWRNYQQFGTFAVAARGGTALYLSTLKLHDSVPDLLRRTIFALSQELGRRWYPGQKDLGLWDYERLKARSEDLIGRGMNEWEVDSVLLREGVARVHERPVKHVVLAAVEFLNFAAFGDVPLMVAPALRANFPGGREGIFVAKLLFRLVGYVVFFLALVGLLMIPRTEAPWAFAATVVGYTLIAYALVYADRRYVVPLVPILNLLVVFGWVRWHSSGRNIPGGIRYLPTEAGVATPVQARLARRTSSRTPWGQTRSLLSASSSCSGSSQGWIVVMPPPPFWGGAKTLGLGDE